MTHPAASEGEHENGVSVRDRGVLVANVEDKRRLAVGAGGHEAGGSAGPECGGCQEPSGHFAALVPQRNGWHDEPGVIGKQSDDLSYVTCLVGLREPLHQHPLQCRIRRWRFRAGGVRAVILEGCPGALEGAGH